MDLNRLLPKNLQFRAGLLLGLTVVVAVAFVAYVLFARGAFEKTQSLTLVADNAEGVSIGMDLSFSGFAIGRVNRMSLADDGRARIEIRVPLDDAKWLKTSTIFTLERGIVGGARLRAYTGSLNDPPLPDKAQRNVLRGDTQDEIPRMVASLRATLANLEQITGPGGSLHASLENVREATEKLSGKHGALSAVLGSDEEAKKVIAAIERANALLASLGGVAQRLDGAVGRADGMIGKADGMLGKADQRIFGEGGVVDGTQRAVAQTNEILGGVRDSLRKADQLLADAQAVSGNMKAATTDLGVLRAEVEATLRRVSGLIEEVNRKWPFQRETEIKLP